MRLREGFVTHVVVMLVAAYGTGAATSADAASVVSTRKEGGVEIISSRSVPTIAPMPVAPGVPASSAADAHRRLEAGGVRGRLVLTF